MGQKESTEGRPLIGFLIVVLRLPVGIVGTLVVTVFFATWLILETTVAVLVFPPAAIIANQDWIRRSWLGRYPIALREFSRDGFKYLRVVWRWVTNPMEGVDLGEDMAEAPPVSPPAEAPPPTSDRVDKAMKMGWIIGGIIGIIWAILLAMDGGGEGFKMFICGIVMFPAICGLVGRGIAWGIVKIW